MKLTSTISFGWKRVLLLLIREGEQNKTDPMGEDLSFEFLNDDYRIHISIECFHSHLLIQIACSAYLVPASPNNWFSTKPNLQIKIILNHTKTKNKQNKKAYIICSLHHIII